MVGVDIQGQEGEECFKHGLVNTSEMDLFHKNFSLNF